MPTQSGGRKRRLLDKLLIISSGAGSITPEVEAKLRAAFDDYEIVDFDPKYDFRKDLSPTAHVVAAGGDGTIGFVARELAGSKHTFGVLSLGTYNNFSHSLNLPSELGAAIKVARSGNPRPVTLGIVGDTYFLEAAAVGLFGDAIDLGEAIKDREFGAMGPKFRAFASAKPFDFEISGDITGHGKALSLVLNNTPSMGSQMPVGDSSPIEPFLELSIQVGSSRTDLVGRMLASSVLNKHKEDAGMSFQFRHIEIHTKPRVTVFADNQKVGRTPVTVEAHPGALTVLLSRSAPEPTEKRRPAIGPSQMKSVKPAPAGGSSRKRPA